MRGTKFHGFLLTVSYLILNVMTKPQQIWRYCQYLVLAIITLTLWFGVIIWLVDGAWENGSLPTHGLYHMIVGFLCCWIFFFIPYLMNRKN